MKNNQISKLLLVLILLTISSAQDSNPSDPNGDDPEPLPGGDDPDPQPGNGQIEPSHFADEQLKIKCHGQYWLKWVHMSLKLECKVGWKSFSQECREMKWHNSIACDQCFFFNGVLGFGKKKCEHRSRCCLLQIGPEDIKNIKDINS